MAKRAAAIAQTTTTMIQEIRASGMAGYFHQMPPDASAQHSPEAASRALSLLGEMAAEMRGGAILDAEGAVLAADGDSSDWAERVGELVGRADAAADAGAEHIHIATEAGEVFLTRRDGLTAVAITERFVLASLMSFDMRAILDDLAAELAEGADAAGAPG